MYRCTKCEVEFRDGVQCSACLKRLDFPCAGITEGGYRKLGDRRNTWKCPSCKGSASPSYPLPSKKTPAVAPTLTPTPVDMESIASQLNILTSQMSSLPALTASVKAIQADISDLKSMKADIADLKLLKPELSEMKISVDFIHNSVEALTGRVSEVSLEVESLLKTKDEVHHLQQKIIYLENTMKEFEQRSRLNNIEIKGVPVTSSENLLQVMDKLACLVGVKVSKEHINYIARVPSRNDKQHKNIIVSIHNRYLRNDFVSAARNCKPITPGDIGLKGSNRIFINDHLTLDNKKLLNEAKSLAKEKNFSYIWVKNSKILVRKNSTSPIIAIKTNADLKKIT